MHTFIITTRHDVSNVSPLSLPLPTFPKRINPFPLQYYPAWIIRAYGFSSFFSGKRFFFFPIGFFLFEEEGKCTAGLSSVQDTIGV
jgi:hypothetical protein